MRVRFAGSAGGLALLALLAGCGTASGKGGTFHPNGGSGSTLPAQDNPAPTSPTPSAIAPTAMTTADFTKSVLTAYRTYQQAYELAYETANPAGLGAVATDPMLAAVTKEVNQAAAKKLVYRWALQLNPRVQTWKADRSEAVVIDCVRTLSWYSFSIKTGKRVASGTKSTTRLFRYAMRYDLSSQTWKVYTEEGGAKC